MDLANFIGSRVLPFRNPRVVSPPGHVHPKGRRNILVATPMRSGTHILIDLILNNVPAYRNRPLYIDLDRCSDSAFQAQGFLDRITPDCGYVLKTHLPINVRDGLAADPRVRAVIDSACVVTVRRDRQEVCRSLERWRELGSGKTVEEHAAQYDRFWEFWGMRERREIAFPDLFMEDRMRSVLEEIAQMTGTRTARRYLPPPGAQKTRIYVNKGLTRVLGRFAPRIDTTIHTLKS